MDIVLPRLTKILSAWELLLAKVLKGRLFFIPQRDKLSVCCAFVRQSQSLIEVTEQDWTGALCIWGFGSLLKGTYKYVKGLAVLLSYFVQSRLQD